MALHIKEPETWEEFDKDKPGLRIGSADSISAFTKNLEELEKTKDSLLEILRDDISTEQIQLLEKLVKK